MVVKVIIGVHLITYATLRKDGMEARIADDSVNDFGRDPIGEGKEERVCDLPLQFYKHSQEFTEI